MSYEKVYSALNDPDQNPADYEEISYQCWICPDCFDDHPQSAECKPADLKRELTALRQELRDAREVIEYYLLNASSCSPDNVDAFENDCCDGDTIWMENKRAHEFFQRYPEAK